MYHYRQEGKGMVAFYHPIPITGWSVATILPEVELYAPVIKMAKTLAVITLLVVLAIATAIILVTKRLTQPLKVLTQRSWENACGNFAEGDLEVNSNDEIGQLSLSFNQMANNLKKTLAGLEKSEENYRGIFEHSVSGIVLSTLDGTVLKANPALAKMLNIEPEELNRNPSAFSSKSYYVDPEARNIIRTQLLEVGSIQHFETQFFRSDKEKIWVSISSFLVRDESGNPLHIESIISDISDLKRSEIEKNKIYQQLVHTQKMEAIGNLAGGIAHDFNNILGVIFGYTELAKLNLATETTQYQQLDQVLIAANRAKNLVKQILAFSRQSQVERIPLKLQPLVREGMEMLRSSIPTTIGIKQDIDPHSGTVLADPTQVHQILMNLCTNAYHAMANKGGILSVTLKTIHITSKTKGLPVNLPPGEYSDLSVSDTGCGIDPDVIEKIFDPYFTTKQAGKGTGLGLAIAHGIISEYGGTISVESEPGKGTTFHVYFPVIQEEAFGEEMDISEIPKGKERILLVDDEEILANLQKWAEERDIVLSYIQPGNPQQNAYIERYNRTVRYDWLSQYLFDSIADVQDYATRWLWTYNNERPNMANGGMTPKQKLAMAA